MSLSTAGLVARDEEDGTFRVAPLTAESVDELYRTRFAIEIGVVEEYLRNADSTDVDRLVERSRELAALPLDTADELESFLESNLDFHAAVVALSGSRELGERFRQCSVAAAWLPTLNDRLWQQQLGHELLTGYAEALGARDVAAARAVLQRQRDFVRNAARSAISVRGGLM
ncbi:FCD domain-containing protein [Leucobacter manosquensis]|uniref:FCD domain-containing protein n=1 Tax=Leucobacter manosquensis TaxID=2810611 RepID=UPI003211ACFA